MKKYIFILAGISIFVIGASVVHAQVSPKFNIGDRVQATDNLNVRATPGGNLLGIQPIGALGVVVGGPAATSSYPTWTWWQINYESGADGWSAEDWLQEVGGTSSTPSGCDYDGSGSLDTVDLNRLIDYLFAGGTIPPGTTGDVNANGQPDALDLGVFIDHLFSGAPVPVGCGIQQINQPPVWQSFTGPTDLEVGQFGSWFLLATDPNDDNLTYFINFGDGATSTASAPSGEHVGFVRSYSSPGYFTVTSKVYDGYFNTVVAPNSIIVNVSSTLINQPPTNLSITGPSVSTSTFNYWYFRATDPEGGNLTYKVDWGDGTMTSKDFPSGANNLWAHIYPITGTYTMIFTATDQGGLSASTAKTITISAGTNQPPVITSLTGPSSTIVGQIGTWYMRATDPEGAQLNYSFYWDGACDTATGCSGTMNSGATVNASHAFSSTGTHTVMVNVHDGAGNSTSRSMTVNVVGSTQNQPPVVNNFTVPNSVVAGSNASVLIRATDPEGAALTYVVDWGDNSLKSQATGSSGAWVNLNHSYSTAGVYNVSSSISDGQSSGWAYAGPTPITVTNPTSTPASNLFVSGYGIGVSSNRAKQSADDLGKISFRAGSSTVALNKIRITFSGLAASSTSFQSGVHLITVNGYALENEVAGVTRSFPSGPCNAYSLCYVEYNIPSGYHIVANSSVQFTVRVNSILTAPAQPGVAQALSATIRSNADVVFTNPANLQSGYGSFTAPLVINSVSYAVGTMSPSPSVTPKVLPTNILSPSALPIGASALDSIQSQINSISGQLKAILLQLGG